MSDTDVQAFSSHADAISYTLYAEVNHFQANRQQEFKIMMQNLLDEQIDFHRRVSFVSYLQVVMYHLCLDSLV